MFATGATASVGDQPGEVPVSAQIALPGLESLGSLSGIPLGGKVMAGLGRLTMGRAHACVILEDGRLKCWGDNSKGQLGLGDTENRGDDPGELGDALPSVPFP